MSQYDQGEVVGAAHPDVPREPVDAGAPGTQVPPTGRARPVSVEGPDVVTAARPTVQTHHVGTTYRSTQTNETDAAPANGGGSEPPPARFLAPRDVANDPAAQAGGADPSGGTVSPSWRSAPSPSAPVPIWQSTHTSGQATPTYPQPGLTPAQQAAGQAAAQQAAAQHAAVHLPASEQTVNHGTANQQAAAAQQTVNHAAAGQQAGHGAPQQAAYAPTSAPPGPHPPTWNPTVDPASQAQQQAGWGTSAHQVSAAPSPAAYPVSAAPSQTAYAPPATAYPPAAPQVPVQPPAPQYPPPVEQPPTRPPTPPYRPPAKQPQGGRSGPYVAGSGQGGGPSGRSADRSAPPGKAQPAKRLTRKERKQQKKDAATAAKAGRRPSTSDSRVPPDASLEARLDATRGASAEAGRDFVIENGTVEPAGQGRKKRKRSRLAGGRWKRLALLTAMVIALLVLIVNGVYRLTGKALYDPPKPAAGANYPATAAGGYAARFASAYLNWDEKNTTARANELKMFFPDATDAQLGWDSKGVQRVNGQPVVAGVTAKDDSHGIVHIAAFLTPGGWTCMDVSVYSADKGKAFAITAYAAFVACPPVAGVEVPLDTREADGALASVLTPTLDTFFRAYGSSSSELAQVITEDSGIYGLHGTVSFVDMPQLFVPVVEEREDGTVREAEVRVRWRLPSGGTLLQGYRLTMRQIGGRWFVQRIEGGVDTADVAPAKGGAPQPSPQPTNSVPASPKPSGSAQTSGAASPNPSGSAASQSTE
ncbi:hypothetical protein Val02_87860 [Virgisporangium aliadipatigenens]|uniref:Conjugative transposon protein TcpC n=1 Tax=Virgisporangium aliadipatigenens TaxID=741659 RepID=A0A8J3YY40_9ACTN|nr:conjugal transfer protein [Virgisporangium aliadipatigenens]GIJ51900.1 hypothetical protein Val02_87860 [Virgisporangium aliadipatigenens]